MFPMKAGTTEFNAAMVDSFDKLIAKHRFDWKLRDLLPGIVAAGETAGTLSEEGARLLDPTGGLEAGIPFCPPEGDAGTGMVATNSIRPRTGNVSAGTSAFAMVVLETALKQFHPEIDMVMTPDSSPVAMAHSNNCTSDLDAWISLFRDAAAAMGCEVGTDEAFARLIPRALEGAADAGGVVTVPYVSGEHVTGFDRGAPLIARAPDGSFTVENVMRAHLFSALSAMKTGLNILTESESVEIDEIRGHGGFFKTPEVGRRVMAAVMNVPCSVMETAGEGGAWGMALLAAYTQRNRADEALSDFLDRVFADASVSTTEPDAADVEGYQRYFRRYSALLEAERAALSAVDA
jgi:sugar (pentulose or hexulose) kinase